MSAPASGPACLPDGTLEGLKWLALALMLLDHGQRLWPAPPAAGLNELTRAAAPLFCFVLGCQLARPGALAGGAHRRVAGRLLGIGLLSTPAAAALHGALPLNILFTLLAATLLLWALQQRGAWALFGAALLLPAAALGAEYGAAGIACVLAAHAYCRRPGPTRLALWTTSVAALWPYNGDGWALLAVPLVLAARRVTLDLPRLRWAFYVAYPAHLTLLWGASVLAGA